MGRPTDVEDSVGLAGTRAGYPVLVIHDEELSSTSLAAALRSGGVDAHSLAAADIDNFLSFPFSGPTGLVLLDVELSRGSDAHAAGSAHLVTSLRARKWKVLVVAGDDDNAAVAAAVASGAIGTAR